VKLDPQPALELSVVGPAAAAVVHWYGRKVAERRLLEEFQKTEARLQAQREEHRRLEELVGRRGVTLTDLRACGTARLGDAIVQVRALSGYIPKATEIVVTLLDGRTPIVETADARVSK
jgi:membrane-bound ClpP family serine protease